MDYNVELVPNTVLHWNYRGFTEFPLHQLQGDESEVTDIYLKENLLTRLPSNIGILEHLESLYVSGNDITELPREIAKLRCLKCLDVSGNRLKRIPDEIGEARNLKFLILDENELTELPLRIGELRQLRYLSVCDNKLRWLPQRPVYNYHHCEFRFWRNSYLKTLPYSLWYHMFRDQQTRCLNIGCLSTSSYPDSKGVHGQCKLKICQDSVNWEVLVDYPSQYTVPKPSINTPPSLYEISKRQFYEMMTKAVQKLNPQTYSFFSEHVAENLYNEHNNNILDLQDNFQSFRIIDSNRNEDNNNCDENNVNRRPTKHKQFSKKPSKSYYVPADIIKDYFNFLPTFIKTELSNGPISKCENVKCKAPVFECAYLEFCFGEMVLIDKIEDIILSATFCSKICADLWKRSMAEFDKGDSDYENNKNVKQKKSNSKKKVLKGATSHDYFHGHECHLKADQISKYNLKMNRVRKFIFDLISVRTSDVRAFNLYRSYAALCAEKHRHYTKYPFIIHPYSKFRLIVEIANVTVMVFLGLYMAIYHSNNSHDDLQFHGHIIYISDSLFILDIIANFFTAYIEGHTCKVAVFELDKIACHYVKTWLALDLISSITFVPYLYKEHYRPITFLLESVKILRLPRTVIFLNHILVVLKASIYKTTAVEILFWVVTYLSWSIYFQFCMEYTIEGSAHPKNPRNCSWLSYGKLWNDTMSIRIIYALDRAVGMLTTNTNMNLIKHGYCFEVSYIVAWLLAMLLCFHFSMKYIIAVMGTESARSKYYIMKKQLEHYMVQRKFGTRLKNKILKLYAIRFQSKYFTESLMMDCVSGQLRYDILMHTGRQLVRELEFLKLLPRTLLMQIVFKLRVVIFIAGDVIIKINTIGDCLYFIDKGTVAIYSESGQEICHLEDGDFFGEISLVMNRFRTASVVAVTNCELFRLDKSDFESTIAYYPTVYENIKKVATDRFETTCVLDEHHKADIKPLDSDMHMN